MLSVVEYGKGEYEFPALLVLGCFDAIHVGHRELLKKAKLQAKINGLDLGVMMFRDGKSGKLLYSFEERVALLEEFNVKFVLAVDFNDEFKQIAPLDFLHEVEDKINVKAYMSGKDFRFGAQAKGKSSTLKNYAEDEENGVWYMPLKDVDLNGEKVSTTLIKSCLDEGNIAKANELLGAEFAMCGEVVKGEGRGTSVVGFPTVNIFYPEWKHPVKHGVYGVKSVIDGTEYSGIANFGNCPTFGDERVCLEVYFEGFSGDLYGQVLTVKFTDYIRDIETFDSAEELNSQLKNDLLTITEEIVVAEVEQPAEKVVEEAVVEEVVEEPAVEEVVEEEQPVEKIAEELVDEEIQPAEETVEEVIEETFIEEEPVTEEEQPAEEINEEIAEEPVEEVPEEVIEEQTVEEVIEETVVDDTVIGEETVVDDLDGFDDTVDEVAEEPVEEVVEEPVEEELIAEEEQPVEETVEETVVEEVAEEPVVEEVVEEEQPAEEIAEEEIQPEEEPVVDEPAIEEEPAEEVIEEEQYADYIGKGREENLD